MPVSLAPYPQDLHIHTIFSAGDGAVSEQQTLALIAAVRHAEVIGISDHFEYVQGKPFEPYRESVLAAGFHLGIEVNGAEWAPRAAEAEVEYYVYHCRDRDEDYRGAEMLLATGKPVIIAHPLVLATDLNRVPPQCLIEINNRYVWRNDWRSLAPFVGRFRFVIGSDAHQPHWLSQHVARRVAAELGIEETLLFQPRPEGPRGLAPRL